MRYLPMILLCVLVLFLLKKRFFDTTDYKALLAEGAIIVDVRSPAEVLLQIEKSSLKAKGEEIDEKAEKELLKTITDRYDSQTSPYYAASRLWIDAIIDPLETRKIISMGIEAANNSPIKEAYNPGVIQS